MKKFLNPLIIALSLPLSALACERPQVVGYDGADCLQDGLAVAKNNSKYGFVDKTGKVVIPVQYDYARSFSHAKADKGRDKAIIRGFKNFFMIKRINHEKIFKPPYYSFVPTLIRFGV